MKAVLRILVAVLLAVAAMAAIAQDGWGRYQVSVTTAFDVQRLSDSGLELFSEQVAPPATDVIVGPGELWKLQILGLPHRFVSDLPDPRNWDLFSPAGSDYRSSYLRYDVMIAQYDQWLAQYPQFMSKIPIGTSIQGRTIYVYRISAAGMGPKPRKNFVILGNTHAREWITTSIPMHIAERLLNGVQFDPFMASMLRQAAVHIVPSLNPDGYEYCWTNNRMWRKNRRNNGGGSFGVDLNRNYATAWGGEGSSGNPSSDTYRGTAPFSEPELQALRDYVQRFQTVGFIDWHSFGEKILYPWSYTEDPAPAGPWHQQVGNGMKADMVASGGHAYTVGQGSTTLYIASGSSKDWFYQARAATSYTIEVRDTGQNGFLLPESQITPTQDECWAGFKKFMTMIYQGS